MPKIIVDVFLSDVFQMFRGKLQLFLNPIASLVTNSRVRTKQRSLQRWKSKVYPPHILMKELRNKVQQKKKKERKKRNEHRSEEYTA